MKKGIKKFASVFVVICLSLSALALTACNNPGGTENSSSYSSTSDIPENIDDIKLENRAAYSATDLENKYLNSTVYDVLYSENGNSDIVKGYLIGDLYNIMISSVQASFAEAENPSKINLNIFLFSRGENGVWRNAQKAEVHPIINKILNCEISDIKNFSLTAAETAAYGDMAIYYLYRQSISATKVMYEGHTISDGNESLTKMLSDTLDGLFMASEIPLLTETLNATVAEIETLFSGKLAERNAVIEKLYENVTLGDVANSMNIVVPESLSSVSLAYVLTELSEAYETGFQNYFEAVVNPFVDNLFLTDMGSFMESFGVVLPEDLSAYTLGEVIDELISMMQPDDNGETVPGDPAAGEAQNSFFAGIKEYMAKEVIYSAADGSYTLTGEELNNLMTSVTQIVASNLQAEASSKEKLDNTVTELSAFVTENDVALSAFFAALEADGVYFQMDETTVLLPTELYASIKDFLSKGEAYDMFIAQAESFTYEKYVTDNGGVIVYSGVDKVDAFIAKYKSMNLFELADSTFAEDYSALEASLTLNDCIILYGYGELAESNAALSAFLARYGNMTQAQLSEQAQNNDEFAQDLTELYKGLKIKDIL